MAAEGVCSVALVGTGRMGSIRASLIYANTRMKLECIVDVVEEAARGMAAKYHCRYATSIAQAVQQSPGINSVWVTAPTPAHEALITDAAGAGLPVFTEKPIGETPELISKAFDLCEQAGVPLMCGFQRRFDPSYLAMKEAVAAGKIGKIIFIRVMFGDHPVPPTEFLKKGGCPFMDLAPHDVDFVRWLMDGEDVVRVSGVSAKASVQELEDAGVIDNAMLTLRFKSRALCNIIMSRGANYGYDNRIEVFGTDGMLTVQTPHALSFESADSSGFHKSQLEFSFPQRFHTAFAAEVDLFASVVLKTPGARWPVGRKDCIAAQVISALGAHSNAIGQPCAMLSANPLALRQVGFGGFGAYMASLLSGMPTMFTALPPFTRSSPLDWERDVLRDSAVDAVYICSPDALHSTQAYQCLQNGKHALVEKPVWPHFPRVAKAARQSGRVLMVGFQRRYDTEFQRLHALITAQGPDAVKHVHFESRDPVPPNADMSFVLRNSVVHEIDLLTWCFEGSGSRIAFDHHTTSSTGTDAATSQITLTGTVVHPSGGTTTFNIDYSKAHTSYVQRVTVTTGTGAGVGASSARVFGYDYLAPYPPSGGEATLYEEAYRREFEEFHRMVAQNQAAQPGHKAAEEQLLQSYERTFDSVEMALVALGFETSTSQPVDATMSKL